MREKRGKLAKVNSSDGTNNTSFMDERGKNLSGEKAKVWGDGALPNPKLASFILRVLNLL